MRKRVVAAILVGSMLLQCSISAFGEEIIFDEGVAPSIVEECTEGNVQEEMPEEGELQEEFPAEVESDAEVFLPEEEIVTEITDDFTLETMEGVEAVEEIVEIEDIEEVSAEEAESLTESEENTNEEIPSSAVYWHGHYYQVYNTVMTPSEAAEYCKSVGGYLATITSAAERMEVHGLITSQGSYAKGYLLSEINQSGENWYWETGEAFEYRCWASYWNDNHGNGGGGWSAGEKLGYTDDGQTPVSHHYMCYKFALDEREVTTHCRYNYYVSTRYRTTLGRTGNGYGEEDFCEDENKYGYGFVCEWGDPISITDEEAIVEGAVNTAVYTYDGNLKKPAFSLWYNGDKGNPLEPEYDYSYSYINNQQIGTASVVIDGKSRYKDEKILSYKINPAQVKNVALTLENECDIKVTWNEVQWGDVTEDTGYHIEWSPKASFPENETYSMDVTADKQEYIIENLNGYTTYYVRISAYAYAGDNEGEYSAVVNTKTGSEFQYYQYQAEYYWNNKMSVAESTFQNISPSRLIYDTGTENGLELSADAWNILTTALDTSLNSPSVVADKVFAKKDMYTALIFSIMENASDQQDKEGINEDTVKLANKLYSQMSTWIKVKNHIDLSNTKVWDFLTTEQKGNLITFTDQWMKDELGVIGNAASKVSDGLKVLDNLKEFCTYVTNYAQMLQISDSMKTILWEMYEKCPSDNKAMRDALSECIIMMESSTEVMLAEVLEKGTLVTMVDVGQYTMDKLWSTVKAELIIANPYAALVWEAYNSAKLFSNQVLGADSVTEKYFKMEALLNIRSLVQEVYNTEKTAYSLDKNETTAANFLSAADMLFRCLDLDCECALGFVGAIEDAWWTSVLKAFGSNNAAELRTSITNMRKSISSQHDAVSNDWIYQLESDFPQNYDDYAGMIRTSVSSASVILSNTTYDFDGTSKEPGVLVRCDGRTLVNGVDYAVTYSGNISAGTAVATVRGIGKSYIGTISETFTINPPSVEKAVVTIPDCVFDTGEAIPEITVVCNGKQMVNGIDYIVTYENNDAVGTATATVAGIGGNCIGTVTKTFNIVAPPAPDNPDTENTGDGPQTGSTENTGDSPQTGSTENTGDSPQTGSTENIGDSSQTGSTENTGDNSQAGSTENTGNGTEDSTTGNAGNNNNVQTVKVKAPKIKSARNTSSKTITVKWKKVSGVTGYQIQYSTSSKFKNARFKTIKKRTTVSQKLKKLKKGKKYYIRMRAYKTVKGKKYYSAWSKKKTVKVRK